MQAHVLFVEELREDQYLPTVLTCEVVRERLQLVKHDVLDVVIVEDRVEHETIRVILCAVCLTCTHLVE